MSRRKTFGGYKDACLANHFISPLLGEVKKKNCRLNQLLISSNGRYESMLNPTLFAFSASLISGSLVMAGSSPTLPSRRRTCFARDGIKYSEIRATHVACLRRSKTGRPEFEASLFRHFGFEKRTRVINSSWIWMSPSI